MKSHHTYAGDPRHHSDDIVKLRAENEALRAEVEQLRSVLDDIYPSLASRAMCLREAGEGVAYGHWAEICRKVASTWPPPSTPPALP